ADVGGVAVVVGGVGERGEDALADCHGVYLVGGGWGDSGVAGPQATPQAYRATWRRARWAARSGEARNRSPSRTTPSWWRASNRAVAIISTAEARCRAEPLDEPLDERRLEAFVGLLGTAGGGWWNESNRARAAGECASNRAPTSAAASSRRADFAVASRGHMLSGPLT